MSDLDSLIDSKISLISHRDVRYDGILFSINTEESSIVLKEVRCYGTEDRVADALKVPGDPEKVIAFVTFPGGEIKDLVVHEGTSTTSSATNNDKEKPKSAKPEGKQESKSKSQSQQQAQNDLPPPAKTTTRPPRENAAGTGAHLLRMREKKVGEVQEVATGETFDFAAGLNIFKKDEVLAKVATEKPDEDIPTSKYKKDDFFDTMSCDLTDRERGIKTRMSYAEERSLNQDTFGAIALQNNYNRRNFGGRGRGRGYGRGRGRGYNNNYNRNNNTNKAITMNQSWSNVAKGTAA